jgi:hypothetical protein
LINAYSGAGLKGRSGLILFVQTVGDLVTFNPHIHGLAADGLLRVGGVFVAPPRVPVKLLEQGFRSEALKPLCWPSIPSVSGSRRACSPGATADSPSIAAFAFAPATPRARLIHMGYEVDPLVCAKCGAPMQAIALIDDAAVIRRILEHPGCWAPRQNQRAPPTDAKGIDGLKPPVQEWTYHPVPDIAGVAQRRQRAGSIGAQGKTCFAAGMEIDCTAIYH